MCSLHLNMSKSEYKNGMRQDEAQQQETEYYKMGHQGRDWTGHQDKTG